MATSNFWKNSAEPCNRHTNEKFAEHTRMQSCRFVRLLARCVCSWVSTWRADTAWAHKQTKAWESSAKKYPGNKSTSSGVAPVRQSYRAGVTFIPITPCAMGPTAMEDHPCRTSSQQDSHSPTATATTKRSRRPLLCTVALFQSCAPNAGVAPCSCAAYLPAQEVQESGFCHVEAVHLPSHH